MHAIKFTIVVLILASSVFGAAYNDYTPDELRDQIEAKEHEVLLGFEGADSFADCSFGGDFAAVQVNLDGQMAKVGKGCLQVSVDDSADGKIGGNPAFELVLDEAVDLSKYQALAIWFYVDPAKTDFFFGRYDIRMFFNGAGSGRTWPAVKPGWNWYVWEFSHLEEFPVLGNLLIRVGRFLEGIGTTEFYFDHFTLVPMDALKADEDMAQVAIEDLSWSRRYGALNVLAEKQGVDSLGTIILACGDEKPANRALAVRLVTRLSDEHPEAAFAYVKKALSGENWRTRLAAIEIVANIQDKVDADTKRIFKAALFDDNYYVRDFAFKQLLARGDSKAKVARMVVTAVEKGRCEKIAGIRMISEIGPRADNAIPFLVEILRNKENKHLVCCWALRAIWQIDESYLQPHDWVIALSLKPGEVHYHLLNRAMDRLEQAGAGAVGALTAALHSTNPQVRVRACAILGHVGADGAGAAVELKRLLDDDWYIAWQADQALSKILPDHGRLQSIAPDVEAVKDDVIVQRDDDTIVVSNGLVEMRFRQGHQSPGPYMVRKPGGINLFEYKWLENVLAFKYSKAPNMLERQWLQRLFGSPFSRDVETGVHEQTADYVDYKIRFVGDDYAPIEFEYHYVLRRGQSGFYVYIITRNVSGKDMPRSIEPGGQIGVGRLNFLVATTRGAFDHSYLHDKLKGPATFTANCDDAYTQGYPDIYQCTFRLPSGDVYAKHEWESYELFTHVNGYAGANGGVWLITPSYDFFADSMPRYIKRGCYGGTFIPHLEDKYHVGVTAKVDSDWEKYYGPMMFYLNDGANTEEMWVDAKRQAEVEVEQWPYAWLKDEKYQGRGAVAGSVAIADGSSAEGAYVILANPTEPGDPDQFGVWMRNVGAYQYWVEVGADGAFEIPDVHEGTYNLYAFKPGVYGEYQREAISVSMGKVMNAGSLDIEPIVDGKLLWQIGVADGGTQEFRNGRNYHQWDNYIRYREDFPDDVHYVVGQSDWSRDWNYMHPAIVQGEEKATCWEVSFDLDELPERDCLLSVMCSGRDAKAQVLLNGAKIGDLRVDIGTHHVRTAPYGENVCRKYQIASDRFRSGTNTIEITFSRDKRKNDTRTDLHFQRWTSWLAYDFIRLESL